MKGRTPNILLVTVLLGVAALTSMKRGARSGSDGRNSGACCPLMALLDAKLVTAGTNRITTNTAAQLVVAYYFHGTVRCETCLMIEALAKTVIEQQFSAELTDSRLVFMPVNYDQPENAHFLKDYKLPCPSLVLVRQQATGEKKWKLLGETWQLVHEPVKLNSYVEAEVRKFLSGQEQQTSTNQAEMPRAMHLR